MMSQQLSLSAFLSAATMALFALTALVGGFQSAGLPAGGEAPVAIYSLAD